MGKGMAKRKKKDENHIRGIGVRNRQQKGVHDARYGLVPSSWAHKGGTEKRWACRDPSKIAGVEWRVLRTWTRQGGESDVKVDGEQCAPRCVH